MGKDNNLSQHSLVEASRYRAKFSGHGNARGAAGYVSDTDDDSYSYLGSTGEAEIFNPREGGFGKIRIGAAWRNLAREEKGFFKRLFKTVKKQGVDLDLGCLYELQDGTRGCVQAFGEHFGAFNTPPFIALSGDDRTGDDHDDDDGEDEVLRVNGDRWPDIKRMILYLYIYGGAEHWAQIRPQIQIRAAGEKPMVVSLHTYKSPLSVCAVALMENVRDGIRLTNVTEYYPGHAEMDRAFGFGLSWDDGVKS